MKINEQVPSALGVGHQIATAVDSDGHHMVVIQFHLLGGVESLPVAIPAEEVGPLVEDLTAARREVEAELSLRN